MRTKVASVPSPLPRVRAPLRYPTPGPRTFAITPAIVDSVPEPALPVRISNSARLPTESPRSRSATHLCCQESPTISISAPPLFHLTVNGIPTWECIQIPDQGGVWEGTISTPAGLEPQRCASHQISKVTSAPLGERGC